MFKKPLTVNQNYQDGSNILKKAEQGIIDWLLWLYDFSPLQKAFSLRGLFKM